jgi:hypothetical protein
MLYLKTFLLDIGELAGCISRQVDGRVNRERRDENGNADLKSDFLL